MRNLRAAIVFLTRVPIPSGAGAGATPAASPDLAAAVPWFPVVGALVGAAVGGAMVGLVHLVPALVAASVAVLLGVIVTGAFHEDGLADVADAFAGGWTPEDRLRILKDPRHGSYGVAALCGSILLRVSCVAVLGHTPAAAFAIVVAAHVLGRGAAVALMAAVPTVRDTGLGAVATRSLRATPAVVGAMSSVAIAALACGWWAGPFVLAAVVGSIAIGWLARRKIGGVTGDVLGTVEQVVECLVLVVATGLATRYALWWSR